MHKENSRLFCVTSWTDSASPRPISPFLLLLLPWQASRCLAPRWDFPRHRFRPVDSRQSVSHEFLGQVLSIGGGDDAIPAFPFATHGFDFGGLSAAAQRDEARQRSRTEKRIVMRAIKSRLPRQSTTEMCSCGTGPFRTAFAIHKREEVSGRTKRPEAEKRRIGGRTNGLGRPKVGAKQDMPRRRGISGRMFVAGPGKRTLARVDAGVHQFGVSPKGNANFAWVRTSSSPSRYSECLSPRGVFDKSRPTFHPHCGQCEPSVRFLPAKSLEHQPLPEAQRREPAPEHRMARAPKLGAPSFFPHPIQGPAGLNIYPNARGCSLH